MWKTLAESLPIFPMWKTFRRILRILRVFHKPFHTVFPLFSRIFWVLHKLTAPTAVTTKIYYLYLYFLASSRKGNYQQL